MKLTLGIRFGVATVLAGLLGWGAVHWWDQNLERRYQAVPNLPMATSPMLGAQRVLEREGMAVECRPQLAAALPQFAAGEAVFLAAPTNLAPPLAGPLLAWIEAGGTAVVTAPAQIQADDALLHPLGIRTLEDTQDEDEYEEDTSEGLLQTFADGLEPEAEDSIATAATDSRLVLPGVPEARHDTELFPQDHQDIPVQLAGIDPDLRMRTSAYSPRLYAASTQALIAYDSSLLVLRHGHGWLIVSSRPGRFTNLGLPQADHAEILLRLLSWSGKPTRVWLLENTQIPPWWKWLWAQAGAVVLFALMLTGMWIWSRARRFGPVLAPPELNRRPLLEHIDASARWIWNAPDGPDTLITPLRKAVQTAMGHHHPTIAKLPPRELVLALARIYPIDSDELRHALFAPPSSPQDFVRMVRILQKLRERP